MNDLEKNKKHVEESEECNRFPNQKNAYRTYGYIMLIFNLGFMDN